jgi:GMP synthase-like glutamine amidotransferase
LCFLCQEPAFPTTNAALSSLIEFDNKRDHLSSMVDHADAAVHDLSEQELKPFLTKTVGDPSAGLCRTLRFVMLGCEPDPPYGPNHHTAELLLDLIAQAALESTSSTSTSTRRRRPATEQQQDICWTISIRVYDVQKGEYPTDANEWNSYDGVLLPGSFSTAYDEFAWITKLAHVIQQEIVPFQRPTLGICFGHQILAHSFATGYATKVPTGPKAGRFAMPLTRTGVDLLDWGYESEHNGEGEDNKNGNTNTSIGLYYTHGDMVAQLPSVAVLLGGNEQVPIQAAAYFATPEDATKVVQAAGKGEQERPKPYAVSFQAHPEYASTNESTRETGTGIGYRTLELNLNKMELSGGLSHEQRLSIGHDAQEHFEMVQRDSVHVMLSTGRSLGWFP